MSKHKKPNSKFFKCSCYSHVLEVEHDTEIKSYNLAIWHYGHSGDAPLSFRERLRWTWKLLTTGSLWADSVMLSYESKDELIEFLKKEGEEVVPEKHILHG